MKHTLSGLKLVDRQRLWWNSWGSNYGVYPLARSQFVSESVKLCLHERLLTYLSPDTVTGDDGRHQNRCRGGCRLKWNMSQCLVRSDTVIYEAANQRPVDELVLTFHIIYRHSSVCQADGQHMGPTNRSCKPALTCRTQCASSRLPHSCKRLNKMNCHARYLNQDNNVFFIRTRHT